MTRGRFSPPKPRFDYHRGRNVRRNPETPREHTTTSDQIRRPTRSRVENRNGQTYERPYRLWRTHVTETTFCRVKERCIVPFSSTRLKIYPRLRLRESQKDDYGVPEGFGLSGPDLGRKGFHWLWFEGGTLSPMEEIKSVVRTVRPH